MSFLVFYYACLKLNLFKHKKLRDNPIPLFKPADYDLAEWYEIGI